MAEAPTNHDDVALLGAVLAKTGRLVAGVRPEQRALPTPCPDYDVGRLVDHLAGWASSFAARAGGGSSEGDPNDYRAGSDPAAEFDASAVRILGGLRAGGEGTGAVNVGVLLMEYVTHGWDLATATGQPVPYSAAEAEAALAAGQQMLAPEYRGPGKTFGDEVELTDPAGAVDRLVAFLGRDPGWTAAAD